MAVVTQVVTVGTTATPLNTAKTGGTDGAGCEMYVPVGGVKVFVGGPTVGSTEATGRAVTAGNAWSADTESDDVVYARVATGTQDVVVTMVGV